MSYQRQQSYNIFWVNNKENYLTSNLVIQIIAPTYYFIKQVLIKGVSGKHIWSNCRIRYPVILPRGHSAPWSFRPQSFHPRQKSLCSIIEVTSPRLADCTLASYSSHKSKSLVWRSRYLRLWILLSFLSETRQICRAVSLASLCSNWIRRYNGSCPRPEVRRLRPWCHPSMSLFVLTAFLNTV